MKRAALIGAALAAITLSSFASAAGVKEKKADPWWHPFIVPGFLPTFRCVVPAPPPFSFLPRGAFIVNGHSEQGRPVKHSEQGRPHTVQDDND